MQIPNSATLQCKFGYYIAIYTQYIELFISGMELSTNGLTIQTLVAPGGSFWMGKKSFATDTCISSTL